MPNKSPKSAKTPKEKAWEAFSHYIRVKGCLETTGLAFIGTCFTCGRRCHINYLQAGHCFAGRRNARLFDILTVKQQCRDCNMINRKAPARFKKKMVKIYDEEWVENRRIRGLRVIKDKSVNWGKLQKGIERMRDRLFRKYGYKTFGEILQEGK